MKRLTALLVALCLVFSLFACEKAPAETGEAPRSPLKRAAEYFLTSQGAENFPALYAALAENAGESSADWTVTALALAGYVEGVETYAAALKESVAARYKREEKLSRNLSTEWHRTALCFLAMGRDPRDVAGIDLVENGVWSQSEALANQGPNGLSWALTVAAAGGFVPPESAYETESDLVAQLLSRQQEDGGWTLGSGKSDVDLTAMALTALSRYSGEAGAADAVEKGLSFLSDSQLPNGGFQSYGKENAQSAAQVILALKSLGIDPETNERFQKNGADPLSALLSFQLPDGGFAATKEDGKAGTMATYQAMLALTALEKESWIFDCREGSI